MRKPPLLTEMLTTEKSKLIIASEKMFSEFKKGLTRRVMKPPARILEQNLSCI